MMLFAVDAQKSDWLSVWNICSIVLTGLFGILGLATDFKRSKKDDEHKKISLPGWIALFGIVVTTILGAAAQMKKARDDKKESEEMNERSLRTLAAVTRALSPIRGSAVIVSFKSTCEDKRFGELCREFKATQKPWLLMKQPMDGPPKLLDYVVEIYSHQEDIGAVHSGLEGGPDFGFVGKQDKNSIGQRFYANYDSSDNSLEIDLEDNTAEIWRNSGVIHSMRDLQGKVALVRGSIWGNSMDPVSVMIRNDIGEWVSCESFQKYWVKEERRDAHICTHITGQNYEDFTATSQSSGSSAR